MKELAQGHTAGEQAELIHTIHSDPRVGARSLLWVRGGARRGTAGKCSSFGLLCSGAVVYWRASW